MTEEEEAFIYTAATHEAGHAVVAAALGFDGISAGLSPKPLTRWKYVHADAPLRLVAICAGDEAVKLFVPSGVYLLAGWPPVVNQWESDDAQLWRLMREMKLPNPREVSERVADQARRILLQNHHAVKTTAADLLAGDTITDAALLMKVRPWKPELPALLETKNG